MKVALQDMRETKRAYQPIVPVHCILEGMSFLLPGFNQICGSLSCRLLLLPSGPEDFRYLQTCCLLSSALPLTCRLVTRLCGDRPARPTAPSPPALLCEPR